jgi:hypothetical protein
MSNEIKHHWKLYHSPDYIGAYAFQPGEEKVLTIKSVGQEEIVGSNGQKESCMVVRFAEKDVKPLICNVTNAKTIEKVAGSGYIEDWYGMKIQLFVTEVNAFGITVDAVRIRPKAPKVTKPELTPSHPKWSDIVGKVASKETDLETIRQHFVVSKETESRLLAEVEQLTSTGEVA